MQKPENMIIVIFGASGDLSKRKLIPALIDLYSQKLMPESFAILGVSRTEFSDETFRAEMTNSIKLFNKDSAIDNKLIESFTQKFVLPTD